jgi:hypothetical protein
LRSRDKVARAKATNIAMKRMHIRFGPHPTISEPPGSALMAITHCAVTH